MASTGPITQDTSTLALGLMQIRVGVSADHIDDPSPALTSADSIGALVNTKFTGNTEWYKHESGFPALEDYTIVLREAAAIECAFEEMTPYNMAMANGLDPTSGYDNVHSGEVALGGRTAPAYVRMEAVYTYPNGTNHMYFILPRAQVTASVEMDLQKEDAANVPITFEGKRADSEVDDGSDVWDDRPLGRIYWD